MMQSQVRTVQTLFSQFRFGISLFGILLFVSPVLAQRVQGPLAPTLPAPAPVSQIPERTTATYGDWILRCERPATPVGAQRICEIAQSIQVQGQQGAVAQLAIGRFQKTDPLKLTIVLPNNVTLTSSPKIAAEDKEGQLVDAAWQRCIPGGCFADILLKDDLMARLRARTEPGRIEFRDATGQEIKLPFSTRGLTQALDALGKE